MNLLFSQVECRGASRRCGGGGHSRGGGARRARGPLLALGSSYTSRGSRASAAKRSPTPASTQTILNQRPNNETAGGRDHEQTERPRRTTRGGVHDVGVCDPGDGGDPQQCGPVCSPGSRQARTAQSGHGHFDPAACVPSCAPDSGDGCQPVHCVPDLGCTPDQPSKRPRRLRPAALEPRAKHRLVDGCDRVGQLCEGR